VDTRTLTRRGVITGSVGVAVAAAGAVGAPAAEAASVRRVTKFKVLKYRYSSRTRVTTVVRFRRVRITARFVGKKVYERNSAGRWTRIPYVWSRSKQGLVYSRYLHLQLIAAAKPAPPKPAPKPPAAPPQTWATVSAYTTTDQARHLLRRAAYGPTTADLADVARLGVAGWVAQQLNPASIPDPVCDAALRRLPDQSLPIWKVRAQIEAGAISGWENMQHVLRNHAVRALWSKRQLLTVMEEFWGNHFNVTCPGDGISESRNHYSHVIRANAFGRFADLLRITSQHPAMLTYLNNRDSDAEHPNENQGRELLELHTVGVETGYGEVGVLNAARVLTGLSVDNESGEYEYKPWRHWTGRVGVLGWSLPNATQEGGEAVARSLFDYLARHPATAKRICRKLATRFVSDNPPDSLVTSMAAVYTANDTRIAPVLAHMFASQQFAGSIGAKLNRPYENVISMARLLGAAPPLEDMDGPLSLVWLAEDSGQQPFGQPFPTGHADVATAWLSPSSLLHRWNTTANVVNGWWPNDLVRPVLRTHLLGSTVPATHGDLVDAVSRALFGRVLLPAHRAAALTFLGRAAADPVTTTSAAITYRLPTLVTMLLDTPYQTTR
jgi:uncharacterized protein (DUF1800 family)